MTLEERVGKLERKVAALEESQRGAGGARIGPTWRVVEQPYPAASSPVCALFQSQAAGGGWQTVAILGPDGSLAPREG